MLTTLATLLLPELQQFFCMIVRDVQTFVCPLIHLAIHFHSSIIHSLACFIVFRLVRMGFCLGLVCSRHPNRAREHVARLNKPLSLVRYEFVASRGKVRLQHGLYDGLFGVQPSFKPRLFGCLSEHPKTFCGLNRVLEFQFLLNVRVIRLTFFSVNE